jgi:hypothetical protein
MLSQDNLYLFVDLRFVKVYKKVYFIFVTTLRGKPLRTSSLQKGINYLVITFRGRPLPVLMILICLLHVALHPLIHSVPIGNH